MRWLWKLALVCLVVGLAILAGAQAVVIRQLLASPPVAGARTLAPMLDKVIPAVVTIRVVGETYTPIELPKPESGNALPRSSPDWKKEAFKGGGSGVIVDADNGYILTNNHVIENATKIDVGLADGRRLLATLVGRDVGTDLAVIKVDARELPAVALGDSDRVRVGDVVVAVGNPFGLEGTATFGIISAVMRTEVGHESFEDFLQVDAQTNPGNSGGALVNAMGELIGINTVIAGARGRGYTIGFAIPINMARVIQAELVRHGRMRRGAPGLVVQDYPDSSEIAYGSRVVHGALVTKVLASSIIESAAVKPGDIVVKAANKPVRSAAEYMTRVSTVPVGSAIPMVLHSGGTERSVVLEVMSISVEPVGRRTQRSTGGMADLLVGDILPGNPLYGERRGAQVLEVPAGAAAAGSGFVVGDVIVGVEGERVRNVEELFRRLEHTGLNYRVDIVRNGFPAWMRLNK